MNLNIDQEKVLFKKIQIYELQKKSQKWVILIGQINETYRIINILVGKIIENQEPNNFQIHQKQGSKIQNEIQQPLLRKQKQCFTHSEMILNQIIEEEGQELSENQLKEYIKQQQKEEKFKKICECFGIIGFTKFLEGYYLQVITKKERVAKIGQHKIYKITDTQLISLFECSMSLSTKSDEKKYKKIFLDFDLQLGFYFSNSYDLTNSLSVNLKGSLDRQNRQRVIKRQNSKIESKWGISVNDQLCWNFNMVEEFRHIVVNQRWICYITHGYVEQQQFQYLTKEISIILIARRSRFHAGTRYLKRGINEIGHVANFVENEQIVIEHSFTRNHIPICNSFTQI